MLTEKRMLVQNKNETWDRQTSYAAVSKVQKFLSAAERLAEANCIFKVWSGVAVLERSVLRYDSESSQVEL